MDYKALGNRIRNERLTANMTQAELAEKVDVTTAYIGQIERGERKFSIETLVNIAIVLNISIDYLLRDNMNYNKASLSSELVFFLEGRSHDDISMAIDIIKSVFDYIYKKNKN